MSPAQNVRRFRTDRLTRRELEILQLLADGYNLETASEEMGISRHTTKTHVHNIMMKLDAGTQAHCVAIALRHKVID
jgi:DNA-binding CsgD family transcriptional regulator